MSNRLCAVALSVFCNFFLFHEPIHAQQLVILGGRIIDGSGGPALENGVVVIEGARIKAVGEAGKMSYAPGARVINASGKTILPGLIDSHIHFVEWMPQLFLHYGVTTVYDGGSPPDWVRAQKTALKLGKIKGPRMFITGMTLDGPKEKSDPTHPTELGGYRLHVNTPQGAREEARKVIAGGADLLKVYEGLSPDLLKAICEEAHRAGLEVHGHSWNARDAALAGMNFIEHVTPVARATISEARLKELEEKNLRPLEAYMEPERFGDLISLLVKEGVYFNPTLGAHWGMAHRRVQQYSRFATGLIKNPDLAFVPQDRRQRWTVDLSATLKPEEREKNKIAYDKIEQFTKQLAQAGGKVLAGSDATGTAVPGLAVHQEMELLVDVGLTPMQAILGATRWAAEFLHKKKDLGTIEAGKLADFLIVNGDPLQDISATQKIEAVVFEGTVVERRLDPGFVNPIPRSIHADGLTPPPAPVIASTSPKWALQGGAGITVEISGQQFSSASIVRFDNAVLNSRFLTPTLLQADLPPSLLSSVGTFAITVTNPGSGGGTSNNVYFIVAFKDE